MNYNSHTRRSALPSARTTKSRLTLTTRAWHSSGVLTRTGRALKKKQVSFPFKITFVLYTSPYVTLLYRIITEQSLSVGQLVKSAAPRRSYQTHVSRVTECKRKPIDVIDASIVVDGERITVLRYYASVFTAFHVYS